ncbi:Cholesterol 25-hydroxylase-like protein [Chytridiales sp. JEL 0842]|nr:Cholesterol 25-hydroxylase-like protein [Chytridiales sp. JEL 0842]
MPGRTAAAPQPATETPKALKQSLKPKEEVSKKTFRRSKTDFIWLAGFLVALVAAGEWMHPERSSKRDQELMFNAIDIFGLKDPRFVWGLWWAMAAIALGSSGVGLFFLFQKLNPKATPSTHFLKQLETAGVNFFILGFFQCLFDYASIKLPFTKVTGGFDRLHPVTAVVDILLWMLCFEFAWYTQHRAMHDVKPLWVYGHAYHHTWRKPEHMIGMTNFAFDHVVEIWVTMSSSFLGFLIFPINFYVGKAIGLVYMVLAVCVHWDGFPYSRYHINHHYLIKVNYGSHIPIFDMFFGTYQWEDYEHPDSFRHPSKNEKKAE